MIEKQVAEDILLSNKLNIERNMFLLKYAHETIFQADISDITQHHIEFITTINHQLTNLVKDIDDFIEENSDIFNIEPSKKN